MSVDLKVDATQFMKTYEAMFLACNAIGGTGHGSQCRNIARRLRPANLIPRGTPAPIPETPNAGRNRACPCGSGRKFKQCCGSNP